MSWREILGVTTSKEESYTHNTHNTQKPPVKGNCAYCADSAYENSEQEISRLLEALAAACKGIDIRPAEVKAALSEEDIEDWRKGAMSTDTLAAFARSLAQRSEMDLGKRPEHYTEHATCRRCGPIWLWFSGEVVNCPWCRNQEAGRPIPRPGSIRCGDCSHFERIDHPHLGHCAKGEPEAIAGLWDTDRRGCARWLPSEQNQGVQTHGQ